MNNNRKHKSEEKELYCELTCALTHSIECCDRCKKCEGENGAAIRLNMIQKLADMFGEKPFWDNEGE